jgi:hypothetical protein
LASKCGFTEAIFFPTSAVKQAMSRLKLQHSRPSRHVRSVVNAVVIVAHVVTVNRAKEGHVSHANNKVVREGHNVSHVRLKLVPKEGRVSHDRQADSSQVDSNNRVREAHGHHARHAVREVNVNRVLKEDSHGHRGHRASRVRPQVRLKHL